MVKVLKVGNPSVRPVPWWQRCEHVCGRCGCRYQLEETDRPKLHVTHNESGAGVCITGCPTCGADVVSRTIDVTYVREAV